MRRTIAEDWLADLAEFPAEIVAVACREWRQQPGARRPLPGDIRTLCIALDRERHEKRAIRDARAERWPQWLAELWGPEPDGPRLRAEAMAREPGP